eukprot:Lithocolla_globosa_v1_NODE_2264_length_2081_cov_3807.677690.p2 type:complete len:161 gc:universal NODE_2264_length_2081_cov_3807.677690:621-139(-)
MVATTSKTTIAQPPAAASFMRMHKTGATTSIWHPPKNPKLRKRLVIMPLDSRESRVIGISARATGPSSDDFLLGLSRDPKCGHFRAKSCRRHPRLLLARAHRPLLRPAERREALRSPVDRDHAIKPDSREAQRHELDLDHTELPRESPLSRPDGRPHEHF